MALDMWLRTTDNERGSQLPSLHFLLAAKDLLFHGHDSIYRNLCFTSCGDLAGTRNSSVDSLSGINPTIHFTLSACSTTELHPNHVKSYVTILLKYDPF